MTCVHQVLELYYLSITIDYLITGKVVFTMFNYLEDVIVECAEDLKNSCSYYPENNQLFKVDKDSPRYPLNNGDLFHHHVSRLLFQVREQGSIYKYVLHFYVHEQNHQWNKTTES